MGVVLIKHVLTSFGRIWYRYRHISVNPRSMKLLIAPYGRLELCVDLQRRNILPNVFRKLLN